MWTWMVRVDSKREINDWYAVGVQPDLFDDVVLARFWSDSSAPLRRGGKDTRDQRSQFEPFDDEAAARAAADRLIQERLGEGYCIVAGYVPEGTTTN
jgi:predicted DNA-binding WGR domain protein